MRFSPRFCWYLWLLMLVGVPAIGWSQSGQHGYEASWRAGLSAQGQNPASMVASPYRKEILFGAVNLQATNNRFFTNEPARFSPFSLAQQLENGLTNLPFVTDLSALGAAATNTQEWNASHQARFFGPGASWRLKTNPDWVERGLSRRVFSLRLERNELTQAQGLNQAILQSVLQGIPLDTTAGLSWQDEEFQLSRREWDALAGGFGLSLGRGNHLLHLGMEAKLLSASGFFDADIQGLRADLNDNRQLVVSADSFNLAFNPSFAEASRPGGQARFHSFEYSFGYELAVGMIYQHLNYNREPKLEIGASVQGIGQLQYWNLTHERYQLRQAGVAPSQLDQLTLGAEAANRLLSQLDSSAQTGANGELMELPLRLTSHAKYRLNEKWGLQLRADAIRMSSTTNWDLFARATLCWEKGKWGFFLPVSLATQPDADPVAGAYLSLGEVLVVGSNDLLTNLFTSANRQGVMHTHFFATFRIPLNKEY